MTKNQNDRKPMPRDVWYVRHLWLDKARFVTPADCTQAANRIREGAGWSPEFACVPAKSRPAVVIGPADRSDESFLVCYCTSKPGHQGNPVVRHRIGSLGDLRGDAYVYRQAPSPAPRSFFLSCRGKAGREVFDFVLKMVQRIGLTASSTPADGGEEPQGEGSVSQILDSAGRRE